MVTNIYFGTIVPEINHYIFNKKIIEFDNQLGLIGHKYEKNQAVREEKKEKNFLFPTIESVSFGADRQSILYMSTSLLKYKIYGVCATISTFLHS